MSAVHDRIRKCLGDTGKNFAQASRASGLSESQVSSMLRKEHHSPTVETIEKLAKGLKVTPEWLAFGTGEKGAGIPSGHLVISEALLRQVLIFVFEHEKIDPERAAALADILPAALSEPPIGEEDPFVTFRVLFRHRERQYDRRSPR